eukprot:jgi/Hompol1/154/HPOL_005247-RA
MYPPPGAGAGPSARPIHPGAPAAVPPSGPTPHSGAMGIRGAPGGIQQPVPSAVAPQNAAVPAGTMPSTIAAPAGAAPAAGAAGDSRARGPVEFNHAINYVNKIKNRFASEPDTYRQFLEILQTYQREQRPIQEVYAQVQVLFDGAPDLLDEFKQFLPDNSNNAAAAAAAAAANNKKGQAKRSAAAAANYNASYVAPASQSINNLNAQSASKKRMRTSAGGTNSMVPTSTTASVVASLPNQPMSVLSAGKGGGGLANIEEIEFFEKCKRHIGNKASHNEFLKILNLFSQEIIEPKTLIERVEPFLSRAPDLLDWFKKFVKYEEEEIIYNIPAERPEIDMRNCRRSGHSYRKLPKDIPRPICSGRDELAKEVLSNDWVSHPIFVSETGFVAHKKTIFEEAMYKSEEERYEFDLNIEANLSVISLLEPIAKQIQAMTPEERNKFKLPPGLGGYSVAIYQRVIKKVYDKERGAEVIDALHQNPAIAVPVVLKRLKQKDEEWKRSQREWSKVWREIDAKNCAKALDHQGINFKTTDRKATNIKSLVTEIEVLHREQREKRSSLANRYQFDFAFKKLEIFTHVRNILFSYVESSMSVSQSDEERIREFIRVFSKRFFHLNDLAGFEADNERETPTASAPQPLNAASRLAAAEGTGGVPAERTGSMPHVSSTDLDVPMAHSSSMPGNITTGEWGSADVRHDVAIHSRRRSSYSMYANTTIYAFFRLYQMIYSRLLKMKELSDELDGVPTRLDSYNTVALELGIQKENPRSYTEKDRYTELLKMIDAFVNNEIEATDFEDRTRNLFWTSGYLVFTIDRLVIALCKQVQLIVADAKSLDLVNLFYRDLEKPTTSSRQEAVHRMSAEMLIQDENVYRLEFFVPERVLTIQLLGKDEHFADGSISTEEKWSLYVDQFVQLSMAEAMSHHRNEPFLKRNLPTQVAEDPPLNVETRSGLELKICVNTYKIFFVDNTEDYFRRRRSGMQRSLVGLDASAREMAETSGRTKRHARFTKWLNSNHGWKRHIVDSKIQQRDEAFNAWIAADQFNEAA